MVLRMEAGEARQNFSELIGRVHEDGEIVILESSSEPVAVMVPLDMYSRWMERREARFDRLEKIIRERRPVDYSEEEVEADIAEALAAVRRQNESSPMTIPYRDVEGR
jgi:prevent-host-death family protein